MTKVKKRPGRNRRRNITLPQLGGDHGPKTATATAGTIVEPMLNEKGENPNNMGRRRRVNAIDGLSLTMRQLQAAQAIEKAYCRVQMCSSGGELKEQVDASPKPDATIAMQVDAQSLWVHVMRPVKAVDRRIVEHVCCDNLPLSRLFGYKQARQRLGNTLDAVADHMRY